MRLEIIKKNAPLSNYSFMVQLNSPDMEEANDAVQVNLAYKYYLQRQQQPLRSYSGQ